MIEITKELIEACFRATNTSPLAAGNDVAPELMAWSTLIATLGVMQFQTENDIKSCAMNIRDFFIDDMGSFRSSRRISWDGHFFKAQPELQPHQPIHKQLVEEEEAAQKHLDARRSRRGSIKHNP